ncbi:MAG: helix-turn-helix transcriptional regulator [Armatimonadetes bacterium]|nr:helix-turn-helix transcriptional regulator [Armatimonadota bacterium]
MTEVVTSLPARVRRFREERGLSQTKLARRSGISRSHLCEIEKGKTRPSLRTIQKIARTLEVTDEQLVDGVYFRRRRGGRRILRKHRARLRRAFRHGGQPPEPLPTLRVAYRESSYTPLGNELLSALNAQTRPPEFWRALKRISTHQNGDEQVFTLHLLV